MTAAPTADRNKPVGALAPVRAVVTSPFHPPLSAAHPYMSSNLACRRADHNPCTGIHRHSALDSHGGSAMAAWPEISGARSQMAACRGPSAHRQSSHSSGATCAIRWCAYACLVAGLRAEVAARTCTVQVERAPDSATPSWESSVAATPWPATVLPHLGYLIFRVEHVRPRLRHRKLTRHRSG